MLGTQLLDVVFVPLFLSGIETIDDTHGSGYGQGIIHADYTHSLLGALLISLIAGLVAKRFWGSRASLIMTGVVFSHWVLDLIVHRADMPLLPGNWGHLPLLGLGAWTLGKTFSIGLELLILLTGFAMYVRSSFRRAGNEKRGWAVLSSAVLGIALACSLLTDVMSLFFREAAR